MNERLRKGGLWAAFKNFEIAEDGIARCLPGEGISPQQCSGEYQDYFFSTIIVVAKDADLAANLAGWEFRRMYVYVSDS